MRRKRDNTEGFLGLARVRTVIRQQGNPALRGNLKAALDRAIDCGKSTLGHNKDDREIPQADISDLAVALLEPDLYLSVRYLTYLA